MILSSTCLICLGVKSMWNVLCKYFSAPAVFWWEIPILALLFTSWVAKHKLDFSVMETDKSWQLSEKMHALKEPAPWLPPRLLCPSPAPAVVTRPPCQGSYQAHFRPNHCCKWMNGHLEPRAEQSLFSDTAISISTSSPVGPSLSDQFPVLGQLEITHGRHCRG